MQLNEHGNVTRSEEAGSVDTYDWSVDSGGTGNTLDAMTRARGDDTFTRTYTYDALGNRTGTTDASMVETRAFDTHHSAPRSYSNSVTGYTQSWDYDGDGRPTGFGIAGQNYGVTPAPNGLVSSIQSPGGGTTNFDRTAQGFLSGVTPPVGPSTSIVPDFEGRPSSVDRGNFTTSTTYNAFGQPETTIVGATGESISTERTYHSDGRLRTETDPNGVVYAYTYDSEDRTRVVEIARTHTDPSVSATMRFAYDVRGRQIAQQDWAGNVTCTTYNDNANLVTVQELATSSTTSTLYDARGNPTLVSVSFGGAALVTTEYVRDDIGRVVSETTTYDAQGSSSLTPRVRTFVYESTGAGLTVTITEASATPASGDHAHLRHPGAPALRTRRRRIHRPHHHLRLRQPTAT